MDPNHPLLQVADDDPIPFPPSQPTLQRLDRALLCPICKELFKAPVSIACGHSFCSACIRSFLDVSKKCPSCHEVAKEGSIRRNRALEEMSDAWEAARPGLLELSQQRKRDRTSGTGANAAGPSKRRRRSHQSPAKSPSKLPTPEDEVELVDSSDYDADDPQQLDESDEGQCPICAATMEISAIARHIDLGCPPPKPRAGSSKADWKKLFSGAGGGKSKSVELKRIVKPNYSLTATAELKALLTEHGLPTAGDRPTLEARFQEWTVLFNANMDKTSPSSLQALRAQLASIEASRRRDRERGREDEVEALASREGLVKHAKEHRSDFERLRDEIMARKKRKAEGDGLSVDTAVEVE